ncbi:outer membrane protein assembly factor BamA [Marivivens niveibacter]|uniref:Outer membrane protein assembly factor BamA n=2 Tax=Marivivens niveibacter TaxID=1930667 RepID=A0A251WV14_9RHOB|nr:outer membrane protein assembly factor BamA [Marivivens niveibacter]
MPSGKAILKMTAVAGIAALTVQPLPSLAQNFAFNSVSIEGNARIEDETILSYLGVAQGEAVTAAQLNDAGQRIRATGLFENVEIIPQGSQLVIRVTEFPTVFRINFEGNSRLKDDDLFATIRSTERRIYSPTDVEQDVADITAAYAASGRINAVVTPRIIRLPDNRVNLVFEISENGVTEIERIGFAGNRTFSDRRLRNVLTTKQAGALRTFIGRDTYSPERLEFDKQVLTDFYQSRGFPDFIVQDVAVQLTSERDAFVVTYNVEEGQRYSIGGVSVTSELNDVVDLAAFNDVIRTRNGDTYSPVSIENDISRLEDLATRLGMQFVQVEPRIVRNEANQTLDLTFALVRGERIFVERIDIEGNNTTLDRVVRQQFRVVEGDPFNPRAIRQAAERIRSLGFFANAAVNTRQGSAPDQVVVDVDVVEAPTGSLSFGANYNTDDGFGLLASFRQSNFLGRGQSLNLSFSTAESNKYFQLSFAEPYLLGRNLRFGLDTNYVITNNEGADYDTETFTFKPSLGFAVSERGNLQTYVQTRYSDITNAVNGEVAPETFADSEEDGRWTQSVGYTYSFDSRRDGLDEETGYKLRFGQEFGFGDTQFVKTTASAGATTSVLNDALTLTATVEGGYLHYNKGDSSIVDRFFLRGSQMRGFSLYGMGPRYYDDSGATTVNDSLGGNAYAVARLEAEFPLGLPEEYGISGGAFVDYGSLWDPGFDCSGANYYYCDFTPRTIAGVSIFWDTPIGPLRFNFTEALDVQEFDETKGFDVTISTSF